MARKYVKEINGIRINLALLDDKYQKNPDLMIKHICKTTKAKDFVVKPIVEDYFVNYKKEEMNNNNILEKKIRRYLKIGKIIGKIALILLSLIALFVLISFFIAKYNNQDRLFLSEVFNFKKYFNSISPLLSILKILIILLLIIIMLFSLFFIFNRKKYNINKKESEEDVLNTLNIKEEHITVDDILKDEHKEAQNTEL